MLLSVLICTHNPRRDYLDQVLAALRAQTLPVAEWELIVVDNASARPVAAKVATAKVNMRRASVTRPGLTESMTLNKVSEAP